MPDLRRIVRDDRLNLAPDVYIRDNPLDDGTWHTGPLASSPDIILVPDLVDDPAARYGEESGNATRGMIGYEVELERDNYIYTRVRNRGGSDATDVTVDVYWSEPATLPQPEMWSLVGSTTIPRVPRGDQLTVSPPIVWPASELPETTGHYCLMAFVDRELPGRDRFAIVTRMGRLTRYSVEQFRQYVRGANDVAWRNFNVVPHNDLAEREEYPFDVAFTDDSDGSDDADDERPMSLETRAQLPAGARMYLEIPSYLASQFADGHLLYPDEVDWDVDEDRQDALWVPVPAAGICRFDDLWIPSDEPTRLRLLVDPPENLTDGEFEIVVRQLHDDEEVGRVTWLLVSPERMAERRAEFEDMTLPTEDRGLSIREIHADAAGDDRENLTDEYVMLANTGADSLDLGGYVVDYDDDDQQYEIPEDTVVEPNAELTIRTGDGDDSADELYAGFRAPVLNNRGDTVRVRNAAGAVVAIKAYGASARP
jgi:hypothetical protein